MARHEEEPHGVNEPHLGVAHENEQRDFTYAQCRGLVAVP